MSLTIPLGLKIAIESGNCILFIGAGIGYDMKDSTGNPIPDGGSLAKELANHFKIDTNSEDLMKVSQIISLRRPRADLDNYLRKRFANIEPGDNVKWLTTNRWKAIYTTNYDFGIERAYEHNSSPLQTPISISATQDLVDFDSNFEVPIIHIHGSLFGASQNIVITQDDYTTFRERRRMLFEALKLQFATSTFLYIGYSHRDPNWSVVWQELVTEFAPSKPPVSYRVSPKTDPIDVEILKASGLESIEAYFNDFAVVARNELSSAKLEPSHLHQLVKSIPKDLVDAFNSNPAAVLRLLKSWEYVNQAPFDALPNTEAFLRGDTPNWATLGGGHYFHRDIEDEIFDRLLDYATGSSKVPASHVLLAPAGYGISTILMSIAVRLVTEKVGPIFYHRNGNPILEGDIEYAMSLFPNISFFIVDNAADYKHGLGKAINVLRDQNKTALFLLGEQKNEWKQSKSRVFGQQFPVEALSDGEIERLLNFLTDHHALNKLQPLSRELQFSAIKKTHGKELLVAMREATEELGFDAILENEYRGIHGDISKQLYLVVACIYQHGAYVRDEILASILETSILDMYSNTNDGLDGVVIFDCIDDDKKVYAARTRHRTIARIVWERCGDSMQKEEILQNLVSKVNLNYLSDVKAFEQLTRNDHLIDSIRTLDGKTQFFEMACKKDPRSAYVKQHYARMLLRAKKPELALGQVEQAFNIPGKIPNVLHHTKGMALKAMGIASESSEVGRKYIARAEQSFRHLITLNSKDAYAFQSLANLFLDWAKKSESDDEATKYIQKAEETITEGLRSVKVRDSLWIASSEIANWLGDQPSRLSALQQAVQEVPTSVVARYLLARQYRTTGDPGKAVDTLDLTIKNNPDEHRSILEYALAILETGKSRKEAIAVLSLSRTYGLGDPRFIATYGGLLYLNEDFSDAKIIFQESIKREFVGPDIQKYLYKPVDPVTKEPLRIVGKVVDVSFRSSTVEIEGWPLVTCSSSKVEGAIFRINMKVEVEIVFSAKGPVAISPRIL